MVTDNTGADAYDSPQSMEDTSHREMRPRQAAGTFSTADIPLIRRALESYLSVLESSGLPIKDSELRGIGNLLHRLGRIKKG